MQTKKQKWGRRGNEAMLSSWVLKSAIFVIASGILCLCLCVTSTNRYQRCRKEFHFGGAEVVAAAPLGWSGRMPPPKKILNFTHSEIVSRF